MPTQALEAPTLGIDDANMKAAANTQVSSGVIDIRKVFGFKAVVTVVNTGGGAAGTAKLTITHLKDDKTTTLHSADILTSIDTKTAGTTRNVVKWGYGTTPTVDGAATLDADGAEVLAIGKWMQVTLEVTTQNDGTTSTADVDLQLESL